MAAGTAGHQACFFLPSFFASFASLFFLSRCVLFPCCTLVLGLQLAVFPPEALSARLLLLLGRPEGLGSHGRCSPTALALRVSWRAVPAVCSRKAAACHKAGNGEHASFLFSFATLVSLQPTRHSLRRSGANVLNYLAGSHAPFWMALESWSSYSHCCRNDKAGSHTHARVLGSFF